MRRYFCQFGLQLLENFWIILSYLQFDLENDDYTRKVVQRLLS